MKSEKARVLNPFNIEEFEDLYSPHSPYSNFKENLYINSQEKKEDKIDIYLSKTRLSRKVSFLCFFIFFFILLIYFIG